MTGPIPLRRPHRATRSPLRTSRRFAPVIALALALAACGGGSSGGEATATTSGAAAGQETASGVPSVLDFTATQLAGDGAAVTGADLAGTDVIVWFWAPW